MGTNYYLILVDKHAQKRLNLLINLLTSENMSGEKIRGTLLLLGDSLEYNFDSDFIDEIEQTDVNIKEVVLDELLRLNKTPYATRIHLGKKSMGWKFIIDYNGWEYYDEKTFEQFILTSDGEIISEYNEKITSNEFLQLAKRNLWIEDYSSPKDIPFGHAKDEILTLAKEKTRAIFGDYQFVLYSHFS